ncbi:MAG TPA: hypothetical protein DGD08_04020 [Gemmatimonas aurantiaca]|uniref:Uncharacterized protein n=1 Tax=Gemmatimonas aurantiaca TaxID=173480 RepID=A0A3D4V5I9_9BACT|nr:hypothetical protein [Gemmatimonas aurantiaca]
MKRAPHRGDAYLYASIEPLVESDPTGSQWLGPLRNSVSSFPKRGLVHWNKAPFQLQLGSLWQFTIDEHPSAVRSDQLEHFQLEDPQEPIEVLDLRGWSDEERLRSAITSDGIPLSPPPLARRVLLWLASDVYVGPLLLKPATAPGFWVLDRPDAHIDAARMPVCRLSASDINRVPLEGERWFVSPRLELGRSAGIQNWTSDAQVTRSILTRLRKMDPDLVRAIGVTESVFREYLDHVEGGRMGSADPAVERARADRLRGVRDAIQRDEVLLTEAVEALLGTEAVRTEVQSQAHAKIDGEVHSRRAEIDAALSDSTKELARVQDILNAKRTEVAALDAALLEKRGELEAKVASFDQEVSARLEEIARRPEAIFAETAVMRAVLTPGFARPVGGGNGGVPAYPPARAVSRQVRDFGESTLELGDETDVRRALAVHAGASALSLQAMLSLHAMFVSGAAPVVVGSYAYDLLRAYASAVAGGRLHWIPIGSSTMEPYDLLGRFDGASGRIIPSPSGLLDVARDATQSGRLHVVVLEGFNRAPCEAYLSPILEAAQAGRLGDALRVIPLANPELISGDDPYREVARLVWPSNVLIACLPSDGSVTLPVPPSVWRFVALVDADDRDRTQLPSVPAENGVAPRTEIPPTLWKESVATAQAHAAHDRDEVTTVARALSLSARDARDAVRVREVLCANGLPHGDATSVALVATLIARSGSDAKAIDEGLRTAGVAVPSWQTIRAEAQRLRS